MSSGRIVQIIGAVIDVEFPRDSVPSIYNALTVQSAAGTTLEVQQQLGDGVVRTIAMGSTEGLKRGLDVIDSGAAISVPVGKATLGRIMDVLGNPIDKLVRSTPKSAGAFTVLRQPSLNKRAATTCWKPASRLSTWFARLPKAVKLVCSVVPV